MHVLHYDQLDITGFAGIRERVLVSDRQYFKRTAPDEVRDGFGACVYLAHAYFTAHGATGLHHHEAVDIVSLFTKGHVVHQGTLGDGASFYADDVLVQCSGPAGFRHNEMNALADVSGMVQLWCIPSEQSASRQLHHKFSLTEPGVHRVYGGAEVDSATKVVSETQLDLAILANEETMTFKGKVRLYMLKGRAQANEQGGAAELSRGALCDGQNILITANEPCRILIQRECQI